MHPPLRWPLRYQILAPFTLVLLVAIVTVSILNAVFATQRSRRQIEEQLKGIAATLADSSFPLTDVVLRQMHGLSGAEFVFADEQGQRLAASSNLELPSPQQPVVAGRWQQLHLGPAIAIGTDRYFSMFLAMPGRGLQPPGVLHIFYPERFWQEARNEAIVPPLIVGAAALATTVLVALVLAGRLTRPILELRAQVSRIAMAAYKPMPLPRRNDELRDLAASVNRLAEQLAEMERVIRRSERLALVGQLAGGLAHHLRNNVTGALMAVQLHARQCDADCESLTVAIRQLNLLEGNLKQLLSTPQSKCETAAKSEVRLSTIVDEVVELVNPSLRHRRIALSVIDPVHDDYTSATNGQTDGLPSFTLYGDPGQLRQMLVNLLLNGADAAGPGGWVKIAIEESKMPVTGNGVGSNLDPTELNAPHVVLRVVDSGSGPAPEIAARLFEPFVTSKPEGIGLGLAVSQQIVQAHGGSIFFSRDNGETCVEVHLPLVNAESNRLSVSAPVNLIKQTPDASFQTPTVQSCPIS